MKKIFLFVGVAFLSSELNAQNVGISTTAIKFIYMKKTAIILFLSFCFSSVDAQLLSSQTEYFIKLSNGQALGYHSVPNSTVVNSKGVKNQTVIKSPNSYSGSQPFASSPPDSLIIGAFNANDKKQVWIIEFCTPVSFSEGKKLNIAFNYEDATCYFMIRNKENGKYITWSRDIINNDRACVSLRPLSQDGKDIKQHWAINSVDPALRGTAPLFLGRSSIFGFAPRFSTTDAGREYLSTRISTGAVSNLAIVPLYNSLPFNRSFNIEPAIKGEKIVLREIETFCPKILLSGNRDFSTGTQRDISNRVIEANRKMSMYIKTELVLANSKTEIWAKVYFKATEQGGDGTSTEGNWQFKVYETMLGRTIKEIVGSTGAYNLFESNMNEKAFKLHQKNTSDLINYYTIIGDTMGDDVSTDDNCGDDTRVERIKFNPIYVVFNN